MYFIKMGTLQVVSPDGTKVFANLKAGAAFGEISILDIPGNKNGNKRTANIRSFGFSDVFQLSKTDLWNAISEYPLARKVLLEKGTALLRKDNLIDEEMAEQAMKRNRPLNEKVEQFYKECSLEQLDKRMDAFQKRYTSFLRSKLNTDTMFFKIE
jgi:CRP-like cAMP-binding protein